MSTRQAHPGRLGQSSPVGRFNAGCRQEGYCINTKLIYYFLSLEQTHNLNNSLKTSMILSVHDNNYYSLL